jgi:hypothetical protein
VTTDCYRPSYMTSRPIQQLSVTLHDVYATNHFVLWGEAEGTPDCSIANGPSCIIQGRTANMIYGSGCTAYCKASSDLTHHRDVMSRTSFVSCVLTSFTTPAPQFLTSPPSLPVLPTPEHDNHSSRQKDTHPLDSDQWAAKNVKDRKWRSSGYYYVLFSTRSKPGTNLGQEVGCIG